MDQQQSGYRRMRIAGSAVKALGPDAIWKHLESVDRWSEDESLLAAIAFMKRPDERFRMRIEAMATSENHDVTRAVARQAIEDTKAARSTSTTLPATLPVSPNKVKENGGE
jgi:hypothetical protein